MGARRGDTLTIGITDYAAEKLGDVVYVDLPKAGPEECGGGNVVGEIKVDEVGRRSTRPSTARSSSRTRPWSMRPNS